MATTIPKISIALPKTKGILIRGKKRHFVTDSNGFETVSFWREFGGLFRGEVMPDPYRSSLSFQMPNSPTV
jgi:hypothetical protein